MATFRKYGGMAHTQNSNIVRHNISNTQSASFNTSGLYNSKERFLSHIDMSGNSFLGVGKIYFQDGTILDTASNIDPTLADVLANGPSATDLGITDLSYITFSDGSTQDTALVTDPSLAYVLFKGNSAGIYDINMNNNDITNVDKIHTTQILFSTTPTTTTQSSAYTGFHPTTLTTYTSPNLTFDANGKIIDVSSTSSSGLGAVLAISDNGDDKNITNVKDISANNNVYGTHIIARQDVSANNNVYGTNIIASQDVSATHHVYGTNIIASYDLSATHHMYGTNIIASQDVSATHHVYGTNIIASYDLSANNNVYGTNIIASQDVLANNITATNTVTTNNLIADGNTILNDLSLNGTIQQYNIPPPNAPPNYFNRVCKYNSQPNLTDDLAIPTVQYVDNMASGINPTLLCNCATTSTVNLSPYTLVSSIIDGVSLQPNDRVLVKSQGSTINESTSNSENGIYVYTSSNTLIRADDCDIGDNVTNQVSFISDGDLNKMKAFVQIYQDTMTNQALVGTDPLQYVPFYSINYGLGQGLELASGATLQVKSKLENFLTNVTIDNTYNNKPLIVKDTTNNNQIFFAPNLTPTSYNLISESGDNGIFSSVSNTSGNPLVISTWNADTLTGINGIRITDNSVKLQADDTNWYYLDPYGHNFHGDVISNNILTINNTLKIKNPNNTAQFTELQHSDQTFYLINDVSNVLGTSSFIFKCKTTTNVLHPALTLESGYFNLNLNSNSTSTDIVRYQACNSNISGVPKGHTFTGNMDLSGVLSLRGLSGVTFEVVDNKQSLLITNNQSPANPGKSAFIFKCKTPNYDLHNPMTLESGYFNIDLSSNPSDPYSVVRYQACNSNVAGVPKGHTFIGNMDLSGVLTLGGLSSVSLQVFDKNQSLLITNDKAPTSTGTSAFIFRCKKPGSNDFDIPLSMESGLFTVKAGIGQIPSVVYQASDSTISSLSIGHNFFGNMDLSGTLKIKGFNGANGVTFQQIPDKTFNIVNNDFINSGTSSFIFKCKETSQVPSTYQTPLSMENGLLSIKVGTVDSGSNTTVRYQACDPATLGMPAGHNFFGDCYFKSNAFFYQDIYLNKISSSNNPDTLGSTFSALNVDVSTNLTATNNILYANVDTRLNNNATYLVSFNACLSHTSGGSNIQTCYTLLIELLGGTGGTNNLGCDCDIGGLSLPVLSYPSAQYPVVKCIRNTTIVNIRMTILVNGGLWAFGYNNFKFIRIG